MHRVRGGESLRMLGDLLLELVCGCPSERKQPSNSLLVSCRSKNQSDNCCALAGSRTR
jgi:hypothetical protein